jgi:nucleotide-binding universal stress UspA family protein
VTTGQGERVVVGVDGSPGARAALGWALTAAARRGARLLVVSAFPVEASWLDPALVNPDRIEAIGEDTASRTWELVRDVVRSPDVSAVRGTADVPVHVRAVAGPAAPALVQHSATADLLVVGSRGRGGIRSTVLGSVALQCAAHADCPVVVVHPVPARAPEDEREPRVVVGLDDSPSGGAALAAAVAEATRRGAHVRGVLAYEAADHWSSVYAVMTRPPSQSGARALERARAVVTDALGGDAGAVEVSVEAGPAGEVLVGKAADADLLVVGSRSRSALLGTVLGSVALHCVVHAPCPVMVVRPAPEPAAPRPDVAVGAAGTA